MSMQQYALTSIAPRAIAWLIQDGELKHFEQVIQYNCAILGGYFNVFIPLLDQDTISEDYQHFLIDYDPDFIVLPPNIESANLINLLNRSHPFAIIAWTDVSKIIDFDPWSGGSGMSATVGQSSIPEKNSWVKTYVAVADENNSNASLFALVACGDVMPRQPMWNAMDNDISLDAIGHREVFLLPLLASGQTRNSIATHINENYEVISAPNRAQLRSYIAKEFQFPLDNPMNMLDACCSLQNNLMSRSFIGLTANYNKEGTTRHTYKHKGDATPSIIIFVTEEFQLREAILFWNLRASGFIVTWMPCSILENSSAELIAWLESDYKGLYYAYMKGKGMDIVFACLNQDLLRVQTAIEAMQNHRKRDNLQPKWRVEPSPNLIFYDYIRPILKEERVLIVQENSRYSFIPKLPQRELIGEYTIKLEWNSLMIPRNKILVDQEISSKTLPLFSNIPIPRFRVTNDRCLKIQVSNEEPIVFNNPPIERIIEVLFSCGGFSRIEQSSTAKYHLNFIHRAGSFEKATYYLANSPYKELFSILSDNRNKNQYGWLLEEPSKRRVAHHLHLYQILGKEVPSKTVTYFDTISDELPEVITDLLQKNLLERGFLLKCSICSYRSWYPIEHIGQQFECNRCFSIQIYNSNPLCLYKLPEVTFQGFEHNMQVPLLALKYLKQASKITFEWLPDSNIHWYEQDRKHSRNIDLICLCDGKLYIGEAKSNDEIDNKQFSFYEEICKKIEVDGIVFATSQKEWGRGTRDRIRNLKVWFSGEVITLTQKDLIPSPFTP
jgi:hypothetical protein